MEEVTLFAQAHISPYINPFIEIEYIDLPIWIEGEGLVPYSGEIDLERIYNDFIINDKLTLRLGKMLAPLGEWNQIHADPLIETVTRPLTSYYNFSEFISGLAVHIHPDTQWLPVTKLYFQPGTELHPRSLDLRPTRYENVSGINLQYGDEFSGQIALSVQHSDLITRDESQTLYTIDGLYTYSRIKIMSQIFYASISGSQSSRKRDFEKGGFVQLRIPVAEKWAIIGRGETFTQRDTTGTHNNALLGINYRPHDAMVWKLEYVTQNGTPLNIYQGVFGSFGIMF